MNKKKPGFTRREFLRDGSRFAAGVVTAKVLTPDMVWAEKQAPPAPSDALNFNPRMHYRRLGKTGLMVSEISLGGHWKTREGGRVWIDMANDEVPEDVAKNRTDVVSRAIDLGLNYLDITTPAECLAYGHALKGRREKMYVGADDGVLCPRSPDYRNVKAQVHNVDECLRRLKTDYLDIWRVQADMGGNHTDDEVAIMVETFEKVHAQGKARWLGISSHNRQFLQHVIEKFPQFSVVIFPYTAKSKVEEASAGEGGDDHRKSLFESARKNDVGILTIKPFAGGSLFHVKCKFPVLDAGSDEDHEMARLTLRYILANETISAALPGMTTVQEVENNVAASEAHGATSLDPAENLKLSLATDRMWANLPHEYRWLHEWEWV